MSFGKHWTYDQLKPFIEQGRVKGMTIPVKQPKKAKYGNQKVEYDGKTFDSKREYKRYRELELLLKAGEIGFLECQVPYELNEGGTHSMKYIADFRYVDAKTGETIVEDAKGCATKVYLKKRRLMLKLYGIAIREV